MNKTQENLQLTKDAMQYMYFNNFVKMLKKSLPSSATFLAPVKLSTGRKVLRLHIKTANGVVRKNISLDVDGSADAILHLTDADLTQIRTTVFHLVEEHGK